MKIVANCAVSYKGKRSVVSYDWAGIQPAGLSLYNLGLIFKILKQCFTKKILSVFHQIYNQLILSIFK